MTPTKGIHFDIILIQLGVFKMVSVLSGNINKVSMPFIGRPKFLISQELKPDWLISEVSQLELFQNWVCRFSDCKATSLFCSSYVWNRRTRGYSQ